MLPSTAFHPSPESLRKLLWLEGIRDTRFSSRKLKRIGCVSRGEEVPACEHWEVFRWQWWTGLLLLSLLALQCAPSALRATVINHTPTPWFTIHAHICLGIVPFSSHVHQSINNSTQLFTPWALLSWGLFTRACLGLVLNCVSLVRDCLVNVPFHGRHREDKLQSKETTSTQWKNAAWDGSEGEASRGPCLVFPHTAVLLVLGDQDSVLLPFRQSWPFLPPRLARLCTLKATPRKSVPTVFNRSIAGAVKFHASVKHSVTTHTKKNNDKMKLRLELRLSVLGVYCSFRGWDLGSQHQHGGFQDIWPLFWPLLDPAHMWGTSIHPGSHRYTYTEK